MSESDKPWYATAAELLEKATPGPWRYEGCDVWAPGENVAAVGPYEGEDKNVAGADEANGRLIAAAPTLLREALAEREELEHWKNRAETMNVDAGRRHVDNLALRDLVRDLYEALEDGRECTDERRHRLLTRARAVLP